MTITLAQIISMVVGVLLPILVGLVTKRTTNPSLKAVLLLALSAISGFLTEFLYALQSAAMFDWQQVLFAWLTTFIVAVAMHFGLWNPTGVTAKAQDTLVKDKSDARWTE